MPMINRTKSTIVLLLVVVVIALSAIYHRNSSEDKLPVTISAMRSGSGWGYRIFVDGKVFINQPYLPVLPGKQSFKNKEQALAVGNLAVKKIVSGKTPVITEEELKVLQNSY